ncbi:putative membrane protein [Catalinimonas alkaloidigena]|uniref:DUF2306 domain-containing protein n=1 Tax=Catalinimonas alkaloidigena TaxID=1075417 RepID=UPI002406F866|nr:DUF2306 domain-containing protein [Catalinimonas alkaloidigena]MDF9795093.1 putative membrane protein [Catalinimonas alkaloidigena]
MLNPSSRDSMNARRLLWFLFAFLAIGVGLYPSIYFLTDMTQQSGILASKPQELLASNFWNVCFYAHVGLGGIALLSGWSQFFKNIRNKNLRLHRNLGKVYLLAVLLSGLSSLYIAYYTSGGIIAVLGFEALGSLWLFTSAMAYLAIRRGNTDVHENWMIRSYALTFAAVTLRLWLPLFMGAFQMSFVESYRIIAWLCWVPNLLIAQWIIHQKYAKKRQVILAK